jgi:hypothetical protein
MAFFTHTGQHKVHFGAHALKETQAAEIGGEAQDTPDPVSQSVPHRMICIASHHHASEPDVHPWPRKVDPEKQERGRITTLATFDVLVLAAKGLAAVATPLEVVYAAFPDHVTFERDARGILRASLAAARESIFPERAEDSAPGTNHVHNRLCRLAKPGLCAISSSPLLRLRNSARIDVQYRQQTICPGDMMGKA